MREYENTLPGAGTPDRADGIGPASQAEDRLHDEYTTLPTKWQEGIVSGLLSIGQENAVPLRHLKTMLTGWSGRGVRREIETERRRGVPIVSDNQHGYWLASSYDEAQRFADSMRRRAAAIAATAAAVEASAVNQGQENGW